MTIKNWFILCVVQILKWIEGSVRSLRYFILGVRVRRLTFVTREELDAQLKCLELYPRWEKDDNEQ